MPTSLIKVGQQNLTLNDTYRPTFKNNFDLLREGVRHDANFKRNRPNTRHTHIGR